MIHPEKTEKLTGPLRVALLTEFDNPFIAELIRRIRTVPGVDFQHVVYWKSTHSQRSWWENLKKQRLLYLLRRPMTWNYNHLLQPLRYIWERFKYVRSMPCGLFEICRDMNLMVHRCKDVHDPEGIALIKSLDSHILAVCGTGVLRKSVFSISPLGAINLHQGETSIFRGASAGFWELWTGADHAGVTVHFIDEGIHTGDVILQKSVPIFSYDNLSSVQAKLKELSLMLLPQALAMIATGEYPRVRLTEIGYLHSTPTIRQRLVLRARIFFRQLKVPQLCWRVLRDIGYMLILTLDALKQIVLQLFGIGTLTVLYYHRVSDLCQDGMTLSVDAFEKQIRFLKKHYTVWTPSDLKTCLQQGGRIHGARNVLITFDDGYENNYTNALPILIKHKCAAIFFITTGLISTENTFDHDRDLLPRLRFRNMSWVQLKHALSFGISAGLHSHTHADLGGISPEAAEAEIDQSVKSFEENLHQKPEWMSFPFGKEKNFTDALVTYIRQHTSVFGIFSAMGHINARIVQRHNIQRVNIGAGDTGLTFIYKLRGGIKDLFKIESRPSSRTPRVATVRRVNLKSGKIEQHDYSR